MKTRQAKPSSLEE